MAVDDFLGLKNDYTDFPPTIVGAADMNRVRNLMIVLSKVLLRSGLISNGVLANDPVRCTFDDATNRITAPGVGETIVGIIGGLPMLMDSGMEQTGAVASATTTTITDSGLSAVNDYWKNAYVIFTSGANDGVVRKVTAYDNTLHKLTLESALAQAPAAADTYVVTFYYISSLTPSATNYIFAQAGADTVERGIVEFVAAASATPTPGQVLLSSADLDGSSVATNVDDNPDGAGRRLYPDAGGWEELSGSGTVADLDDATYVDIEIIHDQLMYAGGITCTITDGAGGTIEPIAYWGDAGFTLRLANSSGSQDDYSYTWTRTGRKMNYAE